MAPMEMRPVTAGELEDLLAGGCGRDTEDWEAEAAQLRWPLRSPGEVTAQLGRLRGYLGRSRHAGVDCKTAELTPLEAFVHGVAASAAWSLGETTRGPLFGRPLVADAFHVVEQREAAWGVMMAPRTMVAANYASGIFAWLLWVTGGWHTVEYPKG